MYTLHFNGRPKKVSMLGVKIIGFLNFFLLWNCGVVMQYVVHCCVKQVVAGQDLKWSLILRRFWWNCSHIKSRQKSYNPKKTTNKIYIFVGVTTYCGGLRGVFVKQTALSINFMSCNVDLFRRIEKENIISTVLLCLTICTCII